MLNKDILFSWLDSPSGPGPPLWDSSVTLRHVTLGGAPLYVICPSQGPLPDNTKQSEETDIRAPRSPSKRAAADPRLTPRGHWVRRATGYQDVT